MLTTISVHNLQSRAVLLLLLVAYSFQHYCCDQKKNEDLWTQYSIRKGPNTFFIVCSYFWRWNMYIENNNFVESKTTSIQNILGKVDNWTKQQNVEFRGRASCSGLKLSLFLFSTEILTISPVLCLVVSTGFLWCTVQCSLLACYRARCDKFQLLCQQFDTVLIRLLNM